MDAKLKKKVIIGSIIGILIITGTTIWLASRKIKQIKKRLAKGSTDILENSKDKEGSVIFPLEKGAGYTNLAENACVKVIQRYLNMKIIDNPSIGYSIIDEDGKFGIQTENVLRRIAGTVSVSYTLYKTMQNDLTPRYLSNETSPYSDPNSGIFSYLKF